VSSTGGHVVAVRTDGTLRAFGAGDGLPPGLHKAIPAVFEDHAGTVWVGGSGGLSRFADDRFTTVNRDHGLPVNRVWAMVEDESGHLWLNVDRGITDLMHRLAAAQKAVGAEWRMRGFVKAELFTNEQAEAMYAAGFRWILVGFESGSSRILENINKKATQAENTRCVEIAHRHGLMVKAMTASRVEPLNEAAKLLTELRGAWSEVATLVTPIFTNEPAKVRA